MVSLVSTVRDIERLRQILLVLGRHGFGAIVQQSGLSRFAGRPSEPQASSGEAVTGTGAMGQRFRRVLEDLGPTFVKLGQILSTRGDVIPVEVVEELKALQEHVSPLPFEELRATVEGELGAPIDEVFEGFDRQPLASASIAQVHRARLRQVDRPPVEVVVKIQRPNIASVVARDIELLYLLARAIERGIPEARIYQPVGLVSEFDRAMNAELDFSQEADHAERFRAAFADRQDARFPKIYRAQSGKRVLTMELLAGKKLSVAVEEGFLGPLIAKRALGVIFKQVFEDGFFHADPHPGNLIVMGQPDAPVLGMIDLGLVGRLSPHLRDKTVDLMLAAVRQDAQGVADALYAIGTPTKKIDRERYNSEVIFLAERYLGKPLKEIEMSALIRDLVSGAVRFGLEVPPEFLMLGRTLMTIEGVGKELYPDLDVFGELRPYFVQLVRQRYSPDRLSSELFRTVSRLGATAGAMPEKLDEVLDDLRRGTLVVNARDPGLPGAADLLGRRVFSGLTVGALIGGGSMLLAFGGHEIPGTVLLATAGVWLAGHLIRSSRAKPKG